MSNDCRETLARISRDCRETVARSRQSREFLTTAVQSLPYSRETLTRMSHDCRETLARMSHDCCAIVVNIIEYMSRSEIQCDRKVKIGKKSRLYRRPLSPTSREVVAKLSHPSEILD